METETHLIIRGICTALCVVAYVRTGDKSAATCAVLCGLAAIAAAAELF